jgi:hypothetical protein
MAYKGKRRKGDDMTLDKDAVPLPATIEKELVTRLCCEREICRRLEHTTERLLSCFMNTPSNEPVLCLAQRCNTCGEVQKGIILRIDDMAILKEVYELAVQNLESFKNQLKDKTPPEVEQV